MSNRGHKPTRRGNPPGPTGRSEFSDDDPTSIFDSGERAPKTTVDTPRPPVLPAAPAAPKIQAISMKTPADPNLRPVEKLDRELPHVKLRAMSEVARAQQPQNLGNLAPPYDPREARNRTMRDYVVWGCLSVILASAIALVVWFVAT